MATCVYYCSKPMAYAFALVIDLPEKNHFRTRTLCSFAMSKTKFAEKDNTLESPREDDVGTQNTTLIKVNASGHIDQLRRQYSLLSICSTSVTIGA